ncbi:hypothetical protein Scep_021554 [Stephania cephalantha]|uniref:Uncharacterized protein n=1 Tax=Stephania cephalantha TaxID=152367 RepID=A0AAP0F3M4_9MAGN
MITFRENTAQRRRRLAVDRDDGGGGEDDGDGGGGGSSGDGAVAEILAFRIDKMGLQGRGGEPLAAGEESLEWTEVLGDRTTRIPECLMEAEARRRLLV